MRAHGFSPAEVTSRSLGMYIQMYIFAYMIFGIHMHVKISNYIGVESHTFIHTTVSCVYEMCVYKLSSRSG